MPSLPVSDALTSTRRPDQAGQAAYAAIANSVLAIKSLVYFYVA